jgi:hypothetical protein
VGIGFLQVEMGAKFRSSINILVLNIWRIVQNTRVVVVVCLFVCLFVCFWRDNPSGSGPPHARGF